MSPRPRRHHLQRYLEFAGDLALEAGRLTLEYFRQSLEVETKADNSPVTIADRRTEQFLRERIMAEFPDHGIMGEEFPEHQPGARWRWILDPIDGTLPFIHGIPLYTVLIALECSGESVLGVIHNPALSETVAAATGYGCTFNGETCRVSTCSELEKARLNVTDYGELCRRRPRFTESLLSKVGPARGWADAYSYLLVATGRADIGLDPIMSIWDSAALKPIIEEAGGRFTDLDGTPSVQTGSALATNGLLHDQLLEMTALDR